MKRKLTWQPMVGNHMKKIIGLLLLTLAGSATSQTTSVGRLGVDHPDRGFSGTGTTLHDTVRAGWEKISDNISSRLFEETGVANSTLTAHTHNFGLPYGFYHVVLYVGVGDAKVIELDPVGQGWTIAGSGDNTVNVTTPGSGGPHDYTLELYSGLAGSRFLAQSGGSPSILSYSFRNDEDTGFYRSGTNTLSFVTAAAARLTLSTVDLVTTEPIRGPNGSASVPTYSFSNGTNAGLWFSTYPRMSSPDGTEAMSWRDTNILINGQILSDNGSVGAPTYSFSADTDAGLWLSTYPRISSHDGTEAMGWGNVSITSNRQFRSENGTASAPTYSFNGDQNMGMWRDGSILRFSDSAGDEAFGLGGKRVFIGDPDDGPTTSTAAEPGIAWAGDTNTGIFRSGSTLGLSYNGVEFLSYGSGATNVRVVTGVNNNICRANSSSSSPLLTPLSNCVSSIRYKKNVVPIPEEETEAIFQLEPVKFQWKKDGSVDYGFIAEQADEHLPLLVTRDYLEEGGDLEISGFKYRQLTALLLQEVKENRERIQDLEQRILDLEAN